MNESQALAKMIAPGMRRAGKPRGGVIQIWVTRACDKSCFACTQGSNLAGKLSFITVEQFEQACISLKEYFGVVGVFGGNPAMHPKFAQLCEVLAKYIPFERRGLWCNNLRGHGAIARKTFNPAVSNLNVHLDKTAYAEFRRDWPEARPFGLEQDSRHAPVHLAMKDVIEDEGERWKLISGCDINQHWSAMIGVFRGELRGYFCEIAGAQAMLHQHDPNYPDTGLQVWCDTCQGSGRLQAYKGEPSQGRVQIMCDMCSGVAWWRWGMPHFADQVRKHCHECGVPLRGHGSLAQGVESQVEQTSATHADIFKPKRPDRLVQIVTKREELGEPLRKMTDYLGNSKR